jgi:hypothetical protein
VSKSWKDRGVDKFASKQNRNIKVKRNRQEWDDEDADNADSYQRNAEPVENDTPETAPSR